IASASAMRCGLVHSIPSNRACQRAVAMNDDRLAESGCVPHMTSTALSPAGSASGAIHRIEVFGGKDTGLALPSGRKITPAHGAPRIVSVDAVSVDRAREARSHFKAGEPMSSVPPRTAAPVGLLMDHNLPSSERSGFGEVH